MTDYLNELSREALEIAQEHGFYLNDFDLVKQMAMLHTEVSEAVEALRVDDREAFAEELADVIIRCAGSAAWADIDLQAAVDDKMEKNRTREYKHGGKLF